MIWREQNRWDRVNKEWDGWENNNLIVAQFSTIFHTYMSSLFVCYGCFHFGSGWSLWNICANANSRYCHPIALVLFLFFYFRGVCECLCEWVLRNGLNPLKSHCLQIERHHPELKVSFKWNHFLYEREKSMHTHRMKTLVTRRHCKNRST